jgi:putative glutamine amidotransferase
VTAPLIGITGRRQIGMPDMPAVVADAVVYSYFADYPAAVAEAGGVPFLLPVGVQPELVADHLDGVLLTGGEDVDPRRYGGTPGPFQTQLDPVRDEFETALVRAAVERGLPLLAICRGVQVLNVAMGGTLLEHLPPDVGEGHSFYGYPRSHRSHPIRVDADSSLAGILGTELSVNSYHHQAVDTVGSGLRVVARASDGVIEGIEAEDGVVIGVQWHPEMFTDLDPLFGWLVDRAKNVSGENA